MEIAVLVAGSRTITDTKRVYDVIDTVLMIYCQEYDNIKIVEGAANGVDTIAGEYGKYNNHMVVTFPAKWNLFGKTAGLRRNVEMHEYIAKHDHRLVICIKDKKSTGKGTTHSIKLAEKYHNPLVWIEFDGEVTTINPIVMNGGVL